MALDGIYLRLLKNELEAFSRLEGRKSISRLKMNLFFTFVRERGRISPLSASGSTPRVNITEHPPENPANPPMLCMLFRKHLSGRY